MCAAAKDCEVHGHLNIMTFTPEISIKQYILLGVHSSIVEGSSALNVECCLDRRAVF